MGGPSFNNGENLRMFVDHGGRIRRGKGRRARAGVQSKGRWWHLEKSRGEVGAAVAPQGQSLYSAPGPSAECGGRMGKLLRSREPRYGTQEARGKSMCSRISSIGPEFKLQLLLVSWIALGKPLKCSRPQFYFPFNGDNDMIGQRLLQVLVKILQGKGRPSWVVGQ